MIRNTTTTRPDYSNDTTTLNKIHKILDGTEWDSETIERVAELVEASGRKIGDPNDPENGRLTNG